MASDALATQEDLDRRLLHAHVHLRARVPAGHGVEVPVNLDVVADADPRDLPRGVLVG